MSVATHLSSTASALVLSPAEKTSITRSITTLRSRITSHFGDSVREQIQFGSSTRATILPRMADARSDVDYMVVFDNSDRYKPDTFIERLRRFANTRYGTSEIYRSRPTVVLNLNHIMFELVPAYRSWGGFQIPAPSKSFLEWMGTDPTDFNGRLDAENKKHGYQIKPLIRLLKYWNARNAYVYESYALEQWVVDRWFFRASNLKEYLYSAIDGLPTPFDMAQGKRDRVRRAQDLVASTKTYEDQGMPAKAEAEIRKLIPPL